MLYLTKSRYMAGLQCQRRLWLTVNEPPDWDDPAPGSTQDVGNEIGLKAHLLFPGGVLVEAKPWQHDQAVATTKALMADKSVPAIFEAAFEHAGIRIRIDVLERVSKKRWGLREVKSSGGVKDHYLDDVAVQMHVLKGVLKGTGARLSSVELIHIDKEYVLGKRGISWPKFFRRVDVLDETSERLKGIAERIDEQMAWLRKRKEPAIEPGPHCTSPHTCDYWDHCNANKPADRVALLPRMSGRRLAALEAEGIVSVSDIPPDFPLTAQQTIIRSALASGRPFIAPDLARVLKTIAAPALYLDFEAFSPTIPVYAGTRPFQAIPFQWSLHRVDADGELSHREFLAEGKNDPRREFAESLVQAVGKGKAPIIVYSSYEQTQLKALAAQFEDLEDQIERIIARLKDLLPVVRGGVYHPDFHFSYSIKAVGPALCPDFGYGDLTQVADGQAASNAFYRLASCALSADEARELRQALLAYCERDTLAMVEVHRALIDLASGAADDDADNAPTWPEGRTHG